MTFTTNPSESSFEREWQNRPPLCGITARSRGFTLIELLVVVSVISVLIALLLPAVQQAREAARRTQCRNQMRQISVALSNYVDAEGRFPPTLCFTRGMVKPFSTSGVLSGAWSIHVRLLPFLDQASLYQTVDFSRSWSEVSSTAVTTTCPAVFRCPSDPHSRDTLMMVNYAFQQGTWLIYDPVTGSAGNGPFGVNLSLRPVEVTDGLSHTVGVAEVKSYVPIFHQLAVDPGANPPRDFFQYQQWAAQAVPKFDADWHGNPGHTAWYDASVLQTGVTTLPSGDGYGTKLRLPLGKSSEKGVPEELFEFSSWDEGASLTRRTYAGIPARSHHAGGFMVQMLDGAVRFVNENINKTVWVSLGTRSGSELTDF